jgi:uncharacterized cupredoxin-like copper-binding protein
VGCALALFLFASCGGGSASHARGNVVTVTERDFAIKLPARLPAGLTTFRVHNDGPDDHEFILVRTGGRAAVSEPAVSLPLRGDALTVSEERLAPDTVGSLEPGPPGSVRDLQVRLAAGVYDVFCNMEGHFLGGMHERVVVT